MADVFISYTRVDQAKAALVATGFKAEGYSVFYDVNLVPGDAWDQRIERELATANAVVVLWSPASRDRQWVRNEARDGMQRGILCPALIGDCAIPVEFSHVQAADLRTMTATARHAGWSQLSAAVSAKVHGAPAPVVATLSAAGGLPAHLAVQLDQALREALAEHARHDLNLLHPQVRHAAEDARRAELAAIDAQHRALQAAQQAEDAARRARAGEATYRAYDYTNPSGAALHYEGGWSNETRNGYGVLTTVNGPHVGELYAGAWGGGRFSGTAIYTYADNPNNTSAALRYEGEYADDRRNGVGVYRWRSGARYAGGWRDGAESGRGVHRLPDVRRYEGEYANDQQSGYGVLWDSQGCVSKQGVWTNGTLTTPLTR